MHSGTIVDSLDTLLLMGLNAEYRRSIEWVRCDITNIVRIGTHSTNTALPLLVCRGRPFACVAPARPGGAGGETTREPARCRMYAVQYLQSMLFGHLETRGQYRSLSCR